MRAALPQNPIDKPKTFCEVGEVGVRPTKVSSTVVFHFCPLPFELLLLQFIYLLCNPHLPLPLPYKPL